MTIIQVLYLWILGSFLVLMILIGCFYFSNENKHNHIINIGNTTYIPGASQTEIEARAEAATQAHLAWENKIRKKNCEMCGKKENDWLHHKDFDPYNNDSENLMTLCGKCHRELHVKEEERITHDDKS